MLNESLYTYKVKKITKHNHLFKKKGKHHLRGKGTQFYMYVQKNLRDRVGDTIRGNKAETNINIKCQL